MKVTVRAEPNLPEHADLRRTTTQSGAGRAHEGDLHRGPCRSSLPCRPGARPCTHRTRDRISPRPCKVRNRAASPLPTSTPPPRTAPLRGGDQLILNAAHPVVRAHATSPTALAPFVDVGVRVLSTPNLHTGLIVTSAV